MTAGIVVLAHRSPRQVGLLLSALAHPDVRVYVHVDTAVALDPFRDAVPPEAAAGVTFLPRFRTRWGGVEMVEAELVGLRQAVADGCDAILLVSGQDLPLWSMDRLLSFLEENRGRSFLTWFSLPDPRWRYEGRLRTDFYTYTVLGRRESCIPAGEPHSFNWRGRALNQALRLATLLRPPRRFPDYVLPFGGSQWWNLSREVARYVLSFVDEHPDYLEYHRHTLAPDELFFQSIVLGTRCRDEHEVVNDALRFMLWDTGASHPRTLTLEDRPSLTESGQPFARKFDLDAHPELCRWVVSDRSGGRGVPC